MAYECVICPTGERARFVFMDTDDGAVAASCEGHIFDFITQMAAYVMQTLGVEPTEDGTLPADQPAEQPAPKKPRARKPKATTNGAPAEPPPDEAPVTGEPATATAE